MGEAGVGPLIEPRHPTVLPALELAGVLQAEDVESFSEAEIPVTVKARLLLQLVSKLEDVQVGAEKLPSQQGARTKGPRVPALPLPAANATTGLPAGP